MTLPPSPPVFAPLDIDTAATQQAKSIQKILSRTFTVASSCPSFDPTLLSRRPFASQFGKSPAFGKSPQAPISIVGSVDMAEFDALGKSPTIFSLLSTSAGAATQNSYLERPSEDNFHANNFHHSARQSIDDDTLLFPISIDEDSFLADEDKTADAMQSLFV